MADVRCVHEAVSGPFAAAISCDDALPHLLSDDDLGTALRSIRACLDDGALFLASIRDYDELATTRPSGVPVALHGEKGRRHGAGQAWEWAPDGETVDITLFALREVDGRWTASAHETTYRALRRHVVTAALRANEFDGVATAT
jgi:glycine/sarcosine N-methyltransferase